MTMNLLTILLVLFIIISLAGDIIIARKLNKHEEEYKEKYNNLVEENTKLKKEVKDLSDREQSLYVPFYNNAEDLKTSYKDLKNKYTDICRSIDSLVQSDIELSDKITKLSEPEQATKEQILQVLDEQNVLTSSIKDGAVILEEK